MAELSTKIAKFCTIQSFAAYKIFPLYGIYLILLSPSTQINFFFLHACTSILAARPLNSSRCCFWECAGRSLILKFPYYLSNFSLSYFFSLFHSVTLTINPTLSYGVILLFLSCFPSEHKKIYDQFCIPVSFLQLG